MPNNKWPSATEFTFHRLFGEGASYGVIGREIGKSRSAVAGKVFRMHLKRAVSKVRPVLPNPYAGRPVLRQRRLTPTVAAPVAPVVLSGQECTIWQLDSTRCRYPIGEPRVPGFHFCGQPPLKVEPPDKPSPYCEAHHRLTHAKVKKK